MAAQDITPQEIIELKQTMGFRVDTKQWADFASKYPNGCTDRDMIDYVKKWADPPYEVPDVNAYLENIIMVFLKFVRG